MARLIVDGMGKLSQWQGEITHIDRHRCERVVPMKVLVLGLSRTGTSSLRQALRDLGYHDVYHASAIYSENPPDVDMWVEAFEGKYAGTRPKFTREDWDRLLGHCMAVSDVPCVPHFDEDLMAAYPDAKVILSVRDSPEQWWKSVSQTLIPFAEFQEKKGGISDVLWRFFMPRLKFDEYHQQLLQRGSIQHVLDSGMQQYVDHNERIKKLCEAQGRPCLEFNVKQGYAPLCAYLDEPVPLDPATNQAAAFPRRNDSAAFHKTDQDLRGFMRFLVAVNVACSAVGVAGLAIAFNYARKGGLLGGLAL